MFINGWVRYGHSHRHLYRKHGFCRCRSGLALFAVRKGNTAVQTPPCTGLVYGPAIQASSRRRKWRPGRTQKRRHAAQYSGRNVPHGQFLLRLRRLRTPGALGPNGLPSGGKSAPGAAGLGGPFGGDPVGLCGARQTHVEGFSRVVVGLLLPIIGLIAERALLKASQKRSADFRLAEGIASHRPGFVRKRTRIPPAFPLRLYDNTPPSERDVFYESALTRTILRVMIYAICVLATCRAVYAVSDVENLHLFYEEFGQGDAVLFLHSHFSRGFWLSARRASRFRADIAVCFPICAAFAPICPGIPAGLRMTWPHSCACSVSNARI